MPFLVALLPLVTTLFERFIPDKEARAKEQAAFIQQLTTMAMQADTNQTAINAEEAKNPSVFVAGWRPFIGWVCGAGCAWAYMFEPLARFTLASFDMAPNLPVFDTNSLIGLTMGLLGMAGLRTLERVQGVVPPQPQAHG